MYSSANQSSGMSPSCEIKVQLIKLNSGPDKCHQVNTGEPLERNYLTNATFQMQQLHLLHLYSCLLNNVSLYQASKLTRVRIRLAFFELHGTVTSPIQRSFLKSNCPINALLRTLRLRFHLHHCRSCCLLSNVNEHVSLPVPSTNPFTFNNLSTKFYSD
jgi:hypothetical protein